MNRTFFLFFVIGILLFGCAPLPSKHTAEPKLSFEEISALLHETANSVLTFSAEGSITVESPQISQAVGFELAMRGNDSLKILAQGPFGITVGMALFTKNNFTAYNAWNNVVYRGSLQANSKFPLLAPLSSSLAFTMLQGVFTFHPEQSVDSFSVSSEGIASFVIRADGFTYDKYFYNPEYQRITRYVRTNSETGEIVWNIHYQFKRNNDGTIEPETITLSLPKEQTMLTVEYENTQRNKEIAHLTISFPHDAEIIIIQ